MGHKQKRGKVRKYGEEEMEFLSYSSPKYSQESVVRPVRPQPVLVEPRAASLSISESTSSDNPVIPPEIKVTGTPERVTAKWFNQEKGFGFVVDANGRDLFIHASVLRTANMLSLKEGQILTIYRGPGRKPGTESANFIVL